MATAIAINISAPSPSLESTAMNNHGHTTLVICHVKQTQISVALRLNGPNNPGQVGNQRDYGKG